MSLNFASRDGRPRWENRQLTRHPYFTRVSPGNRMCSIELVLFTREWQYRLPSDKNPDVIIQLAVVPPKRHGQTPQNSQHRRGSPQPAQDGPVDARDGAASGNRANSGAYRAALRRETLRYFLPPDGHSRAPGQSGSRLRFARRADRGNSKAH